MPDIHPTAIIDSSATLGKQVKIGPYCSVGPQVRLHDHVELQAHVVIDGDTVVGPETVIFPFSSIGLAPQDLKYQGEKTKLVIGARNRIREHVTINPGTKGGGGLTQIGDDGLLMVGSHVAHDCRLGNHVILANNATLAGHVVVGDSTVIGGLSAVHQFVRIGAHAMIGGMSAVESDVIPYGVVMGERAKLSGLNLIGLERRGFSKSDIKAIRTAYQMLFSGQGTFSTRVKETEQHYKTHDLVQNMLSFIQASSSRPLCQPKN